MLLITYFYSRWITIKIPNIIDSKQKNSFRCFFYHIPIITIKIFLHILTWFRNFPFCQVPTTHRLNLNPKRCVDMVNFLPRFLSLLSIHSYNPYSSSINIPILIHKNFYIWVRAHRHHRQLYPLIMYPLPMHL